MTRETKIGLLVGLAFIIVIGILLSDHMTSTTEPQKAPLSIAGSNVRESVMTPASPGASPAAAAVAAGQPAVAPTQTVPTGTDLTAPQRADAAQLIQVGAAAPQAQSPVVVQQGPAQNPVQVSHGVAPAAPPVAESPVVLAPPAAQSGVSQALQQLAIRHGEEIVSYGTPANAARPQPVPMAPVREYKAQSGDSLSKMAQKLLGSNSKANRDAIIRMNPTLQQNPDKIIEGRTYSLPPATTTEVAAQPAPAAPAAARTETPGARRADVSASASGENFTWYTVKENENLWKIAAEQLGSGNAWTQIRDLNADVLKGEDQVRASTRIRLPNKPVASAAH